MSAKIFKHLFFSFHILTYIYVHLQRTIADLDPILLILLIKLNRNKIYFKKLQTVLSKKKKISVVTCSRTSSKGAYR